MKNRQPRIKSLPRRQRKSSRLNHAWRGEKRRHDGASHLRQMQPLFQAGQFSKAWLQQFIADPDTQESDVINPTEENEDVEAA